MKIEDLLYQNELHMEQVLRARLDELGLAPNVIRILKGQGIITLKDLCAHSRDDLLDIRFLGADNVDAIERLINTFELKLKQDN